jgi:hypothetical protein
MLTGYVQAARSGSCFGFNLATSSARMSPTDIDNIIIDYSTVLTWVVKVLTITGTGLSRTAASDDAVNLLLSKDVVLTIPAKQ